MRLLQSKLISELGEEHLFVRSDSPSQAMTFHDLARYDDLPMNVEAVATNVALQSAELTIDLSATNYCVWLCMW